jgi:hypothetical protein
MTPDGRHKRRPFHGRTGAAPDAPKRSGLACVRCHKTWLFLDGQLVDPFNPTTPPPKETRPMDDNYTKAIMELEDTVQQAVMRASRAGVPAADIVATLRVIADQAEGGV